MFALATVGSLQAGQNINTPRKIDDYHLENQQKIVSVLSMIQRGLKEKADPTKAVNLIACLFSIHEHGLEEGLCTYFGACRFQGVDYIYQGGCGEQSNWGISPIITPMVCNMMVSRSKLMNGKCTKSGHCWAGYHIKLLDKRCSH